MIELAVSFALACYGLGLLICLYRVIFSEGVSNRILALDTMVINAIAIVVLYGILAGSALYFQAAVLTALVGFVSTVAYCRYILRGDIIE